MLSDCTCTTVIPALRAAESAGTIGPDAYARVSERYAVTWLEL